MISQEESDQLIDRLEAIQPETAEPVEPSEPAEPTEPAEPVDLDEELDEPDEPVSRSLNDIAEALEMDVADLYNVKVPYTTGDGKHATATIAEWKDKQQDWDRVQKLRADLESDRKRIADQVATSDSMAVQLQERAIESAALLESLIALHRTDIENTNWGELRESDPEEWAAKRITVADRERIIKEKREEGSRLWREAVRAHHHQHSERRAAALQIEERKLHEAIPDWKDVRGDVFRYMSEKLGYQDRDLLTVTDHRSFVLAQKAMKYDELMSRADVTRNKVHHLPKRVLKSGARQTSADRREDNLRGLRQKLKRSGHIDDAVALYNKLGK